MLRPVRSVLACFLLTSAACGPKVDVEEPVAFDDDNGKPVTFEQAELERIHAENPDRDMEKVLRSEQAARARETANMVSRSELDRVLDGGVGRFLSNVEVSPSLDVRQKFIGWEIVRLNNRAGVDIRPGDVVTTVNKKKIERPNQVAKLWDDLRDANAIYVAGSRNGKPFTVRIDVVQDAAEPDEE